MCSMQRKQLLKDVKKITEIKKSCAVLQLIRMVRKVSITVKSGSFCLMHPLTVLPNAALL